MNGRDSVYPPMLDPDAVDACDDGVVFGCEAALPFLWTTGWDHASEADLPWAAPGSA